MFVTLSIWRFSRSCYRSQVSKEKERDAQTQISSWRADLEKTQSSSKSLGALSKRLSAANLSAINKELDAVQSSIQAKEDKIQELNPKIQTTNSEVNFSERAKRNVMDNLAVRDLRRDRALLLQQAKDKQAQGNIGGSRTQYKYLKPT